MKPQRGFTLLQLLITITILAIVSSISYKIGEGNTRAKIRDAQRINDVNKIKVALEQFYEKKNQYPPLDPANTQTIFTSDQTQPWIPDLVPNYEKSLPQDPKQVPSSSATYLYYVSLDRKSYDVWATLENLKDPRIYTNPQAQCKASPPPGLNGQNFCGSF